MIVRRYSAASETQKKRSFERRIIVLHGLLIFLCLIIVARLIDLQIIQGTKFHIIAQNQQFGGVKLPAKRGEILSRNSKTNETSILATNITLELLYVDPLVVKNNDHTVIAEKLADILVTPEFDAACRQGSNACPNELVQFYSAAFDPLNHVSIIEPMYESGALQSRQLLTLSGTGFSVKQDIPDMTEVRRQFARYIEGRIRLKTVTFVPLLYGADKEQQKAVRDMQMQGISVNEEQSLVYCNPDEIPQNKIKAIARQLAPVLQVDPAVLSARMTQRDLRYVPVMAKLPPRLSLAVKEAKLQSLEAAGNAVLGTGKKLSQATAIYHPLRAVALIPQHWRYYPDTKIAAHVTGFINAQQEPQYGIERTYHAQLRGQDGEITSVTDPFGGQIVSSDQTFRDPRDGSTIVLTIDRFIQNKVEELLDAMIKKVDAESGQVIIMDPRTGRIITMANAPLFDNNQYASVYEKEPMLIDAEREKGIIVEVFNPKTNVRVLKSYIGDITPEGRKNLRPELQQKLVEIERLYDLKSTTRYYYYLGDNNRREVFPTEKLGVWLKYKNNIGVGSYVNRTIQEIYEPGSVMKPVTMAIAIDQGEVAPSDIYDDKGPVKIDVFTIKNALNKYYGKVDMVGCMDFSINTCMTSVSKKLGRKLFHASLEKFGFGKITGIELDSELPGELRPWREWDEVLVLTASYGQGLTVTPLQMVTAFSALANGGKLMKPTIIDEIRHSDGTIDKKPPSVITQAIQPQTAATITSILVHGAQNGFAKAGKVPGYRIAGKTGTSQIAGPGGKYESGTGSTVATYAGYAPVDSPRFVVLVKLDRPKRDDFGSRSAAPLFKDIATFLFEYYGIPPDEK